MWPKARLAACRYCASGCEVRTNSARSATQQSSLEMSSKISTSLRAGCGARASAISELTLASALWRSVRKPSTLTSSFLPKSPLTDGDVSRFFVVDVCTIDLNLARGELYLVRVLKESFILACCGCSCFWVASCSDDEGFWLKVSPSWLRRLGVSVWSLWRARAVRVRVRERTKRWQSIWFAFRWRKLYINCWMLMLT